MTPVLNVEEANLGKSWEGCPSPRAAPQLSRTPPVSLASLPSTRIGQHSSLILAQLGYSEAQIKQLCDNQIILDNQIVSKL